ncbi:hypothetical protein ANN_26099 [Periplaneta americana]|uniref:Uncharacterized protein n=1 Tax=Periplaneta americana TaxID=6978 RepID=A0ABQ8S571_PERAM|nr:hypothetical protein ANN_26099 [Periplaneta americana]
MAGLCEGGNEPPGFLKVRAFRNASLRQDALDHDATARDEERAYRQKNTFVLEVDAGALAGCGRDVSMVSKSDIKMIVHTCGVTVSASGVKPGGPGSIPGRGKLPG